MAILTYTVFLASLYDVIELEVLVYFKECSAKLDSGNISLQLRTSSASTDRQLGILFRVRSSKDDVMGAMLKKKMCR